MGVTERSAAAKKRRMEKRREQAVLLRQVIDDLRRSVATSSLDQSKVSETSTRLIGINKSFRYNDGAFPKIPDSNEWDTCVSSAPTSLAEAMLWKLGRWKAYKKFVASYAHPLAEPTKQDVVLFAFGKYLRDRTLPIYDQHALRAIWAIDVHLSSDDQKTCKSVLFSKDLTWKASGSGDSAIDCYYLFSRRLANLTGGTRNLTCAQLDRLLMPLGQAIKKLTQSYQEFHMLCGLAS